MEPCLCLLNFYIMACGAGVLGSWAKDLIFETTT